MNIVFIYGKIITNIDFEFIIDGKHVSIVIFDLKLKNKCIIKAKAYDEIADECYRKLKSKEKIAVQGLLNSNGEIEIRDFFNFNE